MSERRAVILPKFSEGESSATVRWLVGDGDYVQRDQEVCEIDTDKATMALPAEIAGNIYLMVDNNAEVTVGQTLARIQQLTTRDRWKRTANEMGSRYIVSVCDTFSYEDYPVFCKDDEELKKVKEKYEGKNMQRINEIIVLEAPKEINTLAEAVSAKRRYPSDFRFHLNEDGTLDLLKKPRGERWDNVDYLDWEVWSMDTTGRRGLEVAAVFLDVLDIDYTE